jgi:hypothetical protein
VKWRVLTAPITALLALAGRARRSSGSRHSSPRGGPPEGPDAAGVREPRRPGPEAGGAAVALDPPPDDRG